MAEYPKTYVLIKRSIIKEIEGATCWSDIEHCWAALMNVNQIALDIKRECDYLFNPENTNNSEKK